MAAKAVATVPAKIIIENRQGVRQAKAIEKHRTEQRARLRNYETFERVTQEKQILAAKSVEYRKRRGEDERHDDSQKGRQRVYGTVGTAAAPVKSGINHVILIMLTMFGLIAFYAMVTKPQPTSRFFGSLGDWLSLLSTSSPIFQRRS
jgi:hypothetical protein